MSDVFNFDFASLQQNLQAGAITEKKEYGPDERFWKLSRGDDDTGTAIIRLVVDENRVPFVKVFHHQFSVYDPSKQKKRWFIEPSPQTIGLPCPVSEEWQRLYNEGTAEAKERAKQFSRKIKYITNIKVINDPANPENNGKYFLWEFGTKLLDKFLTVMNPTENDRKLGVQPVELYNPMAGANIMLKIKKSAGFFNYDDTQIMSPTAEYESMESAMAEIDANTHKLQEFLEPTYFKSYDELKGKMHFVLTGTKLGAETQNAQEAQSNGTDVSGMTVNTGMPPAQNAQPAQQAPVQQTPVQETVAQQPVPETKPAEAPKAQPAATAKTVSSSDDDLSFLDDL